MLLFSMNQVTLQKIFYLELFIINQYLWMQSDNMLDCQGISTISQNFRTMKRNVQLFAVLIAVFFSLSAFAADPYEVMQITPAEGNVTSLQHFTITFGDMVVVVNQQAIPTLEKGGGATAEGTLSADGNTVVVDFEECYTAPGQYFLNIPEGALKVNGRELLPVTFRFYIAGSIESFYEQITINPAEGEVESLQNFVISFPEYVGEIEYGSKAILTNTTTGATYRTDMEDVRYNVLAFFPEEVTEPGEYTLTIPAGAVVIYTLGEDVHELTFNYTIPGGATVIPGDVNGDNTVSIADVTDLIDILLNGSASSPAADVNGDNTVSIADVTDLIDLLLGSN